jgi:predicted ester cyclase
MAWIERRGTRFGCAAGYPTALSPQALTRPIDPTNEEDHAGMNDDDIRRLYTAIIAAIGARDDRLLDRLIADDVIDHNPAPNQPPGLAGFKYWAAMAREAFPDLTGTVEDTLVDSGKVAGRVTWRGTHRGHFVGVAGTGKAVEFAAFHIVRFTDRRAVEWWGTADLLGALIRVGATIVVNPTGPESQ